MSNPFDHLKKPPERERPADYLLRTQDRPGRSPDHITALEAELDEQAFRRFGEEVGHRDEDEAADIERRYKLAAEHDKTTQEGRDAFTAGKKVEDCPHNREPQYTYWRVGWFEERNIRDFDFQRYIKVRRMNEDPSSKVRAMARLMGEERHDSRIKELIAAFEKQYPYFKEAYERSFGKGQG